VQRTSFSWVALVAGGLAGVVAVSAATAPAAHFPASPFELTLEYELWSPDQTSYPPSSLEGAFTAQAPFCRSGTAVELGRRVGAREAKHRLTCDDGSGSLVIWTLVGLDDNDVYGDAIQGPFRILDGTGSYVGLRGKGLQRSEILSEVLDPGCVLSDEVGGEFCPWRQVWRSTLEGVADEDAIAPTIGFSSTEAAKLPRPAGSYALEIAIALRDDVEENPVSYTLQVTPTSSLRELASNFGTANAGTVSMTMRTPQLFGRRSILLRLTASDEVGNESSVSQVLKLPR
jgi:hypothetical protein